MIFVMDLHNPIPKRNESLQKYYGVANEWCNVTKNIYFDRQDEFAQLANQNLNLVADSAAAVVTALFREGCLNSELVVRRALEWCRYSVNEVGFHEIPADQLDDVLQSPRDAVVLVPGCQDDRMLDRRVSRLVEFAVSRRQPFTIVFSGRNPGRGEIRIENEAIHMRIRFDEMIIRRSHDLKIEVRKKYIDNEQLSQNTRENIEEFLGSSKYLDPRGRQNVVIISSTFHLIRIAECIRDCLDKDKFELKRFVANFVLIGSESQVNSEGIYPIDPIHDYAYVKLMLFDLYRKYLA